MQSQKKKEQKKITADIGPWIIYGLIFGTLLGIVFNNLVLGMLLGICGGIIIASLKSLKEK
ncbi:MAG: hypothetical protein JW757_10060 [Anaerolineales bacterium]|nr:hypothetical protein [Anaerolineales bacterium]